MAQISVTELRAVAVLLPAEEAEELVLANADEYIRLRRQARAAHARGRSRSLGDIDRATPEATAHRRS